MTKCTCCGQTIKAKRKDVIRSVPDGNRYRWEYPTGKVLYASFPYDPKLKIKKPSYAHLNKRIDSKRLKGSLFA